MSKTRKQVTSKVVNLLWDQLDRMNEEGKTGQNLVMEFTKARNNVNVCKTMIDAVKVDQADERLKLDMKRTKI